MINRSESWERRSGVDLVTSQLYDDIVSLRLLPGAKISEAEIAARFGVSRQPVRDAFTRLANLDLLLIRPQKATEVKRFSIRSIEQARFVRAAVEAEVLRRAARHCTTADAALLEGAVEGQRALLENADYGAFIRLDYEFHKLLCAIAGVDYAFDVIQREKAKVDRLCMLGLSREDRMPQLIDDHARIATHVIAGEAEKAVAVAMAHLARLDSTIESIRQCNANYFEADEGQV